MKHPTQMMPKPIVTTIKGTRLFLALFLAARKFVRATSHIDAESGAFGDELTDLRFAVHVIETDEEV